MVVLKHDKERKRKPGTWRRFKVGGGRKVVTVSCPNCGKLASLSSHKIAKDGTVTPSLICPYDEAGCTFHDNVRLEDW